MDRDPPSWRAIWISITVISMAVIACIGLVIFGLDAVCSTQAQPWLVRYPGAAVQAQTADFLRPHALGVSTTTLHTDAPPPLVRQFYRAALRQTGGTTVQRELIQVRWEAVSHAEGGTTIRLYTECSGM